MLGPSRMFHSDPDECLASVIEFGLIADATDLAAISSVTAVSRAANLLEDPWPE